MNKKLIAVAVASALGAPATALAQSSTVQVYGTVLLNYNFVDSGAGIPRVDAWNSHDANLGFKGEEQLGGGLTAWFQCESTLDVTGQAASNQTVNTSGVKAAITSQAAAWCGRNSAFGMKGNFGNVYAGVWDTPMKTVMANFRPFSTSGAYGMGGLLWNESASDVSNPTQVGQKINGLGGAIGSAVTVSAGTVALGGTSAQSSFTRRQTSSLSYWTPVFGGFSGGFQFSDTREGLLQNNATVPKKPRMWDIGVMYTNGPLIIGAGYQRHENYNPGNMLPAGNSAQVAAAGTATYIGGNDRAWDIGAAYTFAGVFKLSAIYSNNNYSMNTITGGLTGVGAGAGVPATFELSQRSWGIFGDWAIAGPHRLRGEYVKANSTGGNFVGTVGNWVGNAGAGNTGARLYSLQYAYAFSKRTEINFGYSKIDNDAAAGFRLQTLTSTNVGQDQSAWVLGAKHTF